MASVTGEITIDRARSTGARPVEIVVDTVADERNETKYNPASGLGETY